MKNEISIYNFQGQDVRIVDKNGNFWFIGKDLCNAIGIASYRTAISNLDEDEKGVVSIDTPGGKQSVSIVSESGMYSLILDSRKPEAKKFKKWVTSEVLPEIRKTGSYSLKINTKDNQEWLFFRETGKEIRKDLTDAIKHLVEYAKEQESKNPENYYMVITMLINRALYGCTSAKKIKKNLRDHLSVKQLPVLSACEVLVTNIINKWIEVKPYKMIYQEIKEKVLKYSELLGIEKPEHLTKNDHLKIVSNNLKDAFKEKTLVYPKYKQLHND